MSTKNFVIMRDIICVYHPEFIVSGDLRKYGLKHANIFNIEHLVEEALAHVGNLQFVDGVGYDFLPDYSDSKTVTININTRAAEVGGVESKIGPLRITVYNPHTESLAFMFMPTREVRLRRIACYGKNEHKQRLKMKWNDNDHFNSFEDYRVPTFDSLALARE